MRIVNDRYDVKTDILVQLICLNVLVRNGNDLTLFGRRRGSGETIWDIKRHIGYVSSSLHLDYRNNKEW